MNCRFKICFQAPGAMINPGLMMKTSLLLLTLFSITAFAESKAPVCTGAAIAPELRGTYVSTVEGQALTTVLGESTITVGSGPKALVFKAWTCAVDHVDVMVLDYEDGTFENRLLLR